MADIFQPRYINEREARKKLKDAEEALELSLSQIRGLKEIVKVLRANIIKHKQQLTEIKTPKIQSLQEPLKEEGS